MRTGIANLPLHGGKCPAWLFTHMKALSASIIEVIIEDAGPGEVLRRLSDPYWFQALGCVVGFDWHSSGVTTTVCGAIKEGLMEMGPQAGIFFSGGKGKTARNTPGEIEKIADKYPLAIKPEKLIYASKMSAKVDSAAVQDGYQIYHHFFAFTNDGRWAVIQQGMNEDIRQARRYHWLSSNTRDFTEEPQTAICCDTISDTLNLVSADNNHVRTISSQIAGMPPAKLVRELDSIYNNIPSLNLPSRHSIPRTAYLNKSLYAAYEKQPQSFEELLGIIGIGSGTLRALCLVAEVAYGVKPSFSDPVRYSFAHGGKDGFPFPVNERDIENSYTTLKRALRKARAGRKEQLDALKKLARWHSEAVTINATPRANGSIRPITASITTTPLQALAKSSPKEHLFQPELF